MNENQGALIAIENNDGKETVNARDLHSFLEVQTRFNDWIKARIEKYGFIEGQDYVSLTEKIVSGNNANAITYHLSIDMAKELSMVENNEKGRQARQYFIEVEKRSRVKPSGAELIALAVIEAQALLEHKDKLILEMKPKAEFYDTVAGSKNAIRMGQAAKVLDYPGIGRNNLFQFLREHGILQENNIPYQTHVDAGYFRVILQEYQTPDGETHTNTTTLVYPRGLDYIRRKLEQNGYMPRGVAS